MFLLLLAGLHPRPAPQPPVPPSCTAMPYTTPRGQHLLVVTCPGSYATPEIAGR